jgi:hypothetical protein
MSARPLPNGFPAGGTGRSSGSGDDPTRDSSAIGRARPAMDAHVDGLSPDDLEDVATLFGPRCPACGGALDAVGKCRFCEG